MKVKVEARAQFLYLPSSVPARMIRVAISPLFAAMIFLKGMAGRSDSGRIGAFTPCPGRRNADLVRRTRIIHKGHRLFQTADKDGTVCQLE